MARKPPSSPPLDLFAEFGGAEKCRQLSSTFYTRVVQDPVLRPLFPGKTQKCAIEEFSAFLAQFLGGPARHTQRRWWLSLRESHLRFHIGPPEREAWMAVMTTTLREAEISEPMRSALLELFADASTYVANAGPPGGAAPAPPQHSETGEQIRLRWEEQLALDDAVAAARQGQLDRVAALAASPHLQCRFARSRSVLANFVGVLLGTGLPTIAGYAHTTLLANPDLAQERYSGRTLLHAASAAGCLPAVATLLQLGADANVKTDGGHTPLYCVANECCAGGGDVVKALVRAGARVDAADGVKRSTPLHMAARRDNVGVATALLECGADLEARDSLSETPLRRAVNCGQIQVAALLMAHGANRHSAGSKGQTPLTAARSAGMKRLLQT